MFSSSGNDEKLYRNRIASLTRMVSDMQSLLSRTGLSAVVGMEVVFETTAKIDFLLVATEFDSLDYRDSYIAPNIRAAIGKVCLYRSVKAFFHVLCQGMFTLIYLKLLRDILFFYTSICFQLLVI